MVPNSVPTLISLNYIRVEIETASSSVGLIVRRNQLAQAAQTPYVLSLQMTIRIRSVAV